MTLFVPLGVKVVLLFIIFWYFGLVFFSAGVSVKVSGVKVVGSSWVW